MDNTFSAVSAWNKLKLYLFTDATQSYGFGVGAYADMQYWAGSTTTGMHVFYARQTERMRIDSSGNVGIGTTSPGSKLDVNGELRIGNTVNTVSPTSPNRTVTIVIGGTTYYLAAKTTND